MSVESIDRPESAARPGPPAEARERVPHTHTPTHPYTHTPCALRVAIVGCGKIADGHVEMISHLPGASVVAVCDLEPLMAEQLAVRYGVPNFYGEFDRLLERERPDVVHITTPPQSHAGLARMALEAGCHVYVEKPLTPTYAETRALIERAVEAERKLTIGYGPYFDPPMLALRGMVQAGTLGEPVHVESFLGYELSGPFGAALLGDTSHWVHRLPGRLFHNVVDHLLNKVAEFVPDDDAEVKAFGRRRRETLTGTSTDAMLDEIRITILGTKTTAYATFSAHARPPGHFMRVYGTKNSAHVDMISRTVTLESSPRLPGAPGRLAIAFDQARQYLAEGRRNLKRFRRHDYHFFAGLSTLIAAFYDSIRADGPPPVPYRDILRIASWADQVFAQLPQEGAA
jgi:predicted dehydrogenase